MNRDCENTQVRQSTRARDELNMKTSAPKRVFVNTMCMIYPNLLSNKRALAQKTADYRTQKLTQLCTISVIDGTESWPGFTAGLNTRYFRSQPYQLLVKCHQCVRDWKHARMKTVHLSIPIQHEKGVPEDKAQLKVSKFIHLSVQFNELLQCFKKKYFNQSGP